MNVVLDLFYEEEDDSCPCRYYIADHSTRTIFWLDKFELKEMQVWAEVKGVTELTHIRACVVVRSLRPLLTFIFSGHAIESQYWWVLII